MKSRKYIFLIWMGKIDRNKNLYGKNDSNKIH